MAVTSSPSTSQSSTLAFAALLGAGVAVGFSPILARLSDLAPLASGFYRLAFAFVAIWLAVRLSGSSVQTFTTMTPVDRVRMVLAGIAFAADIAFWHLAIAQ